MINLDGLIAGGDAERLIAQLTDLAQQEAGSTPIEENGGWLTVNLCLRYLDANRSRIGVATAEEAERVILNGYPRVHSVIPASSSKRHSEAFTEIVRRWLSSRGWVLSDVRGDGNCFFRSVVRSIFHAASPEKCSISGAEEDSLSTYLREEISAMEIYQDYVVAGDSDQLMMGQDGVWADAIQVAKVSQYLEVPVYVVRCDDPGLRFNGDSGCIVPSPLYQYGSNFDEEPLVLLYDPYPGHYQAIIKEKADKKMELSEVVKYFEDTKTRSVVDDSEWVMSMCNLYFVLENEFLKLRDQAPTEGTMAQCKMMLQALRNFKNMISEQCVSVDRLYALSAERRLLSIPMRLFSEIHFDSIAFDPETEEPLERGSGPISVLYAETQSIAAIHPLLLSKKDEKPDEAPPDRDAKTFLSQFPSPPQKMPLNSNPDLNLNPGPSYPIQSYSSIYPSLQEKSNLDSNPNYPSQSYSLNYPNKMQPNVARPKRPVERNLNNLVSVGEASVDDWAASIELNKKAIEKEKTLELKCAIINYDAMDTLLCCVESGKVDIRRLVLDRCLVGDGGIDVIVRHCKQGRLPCVITMKGCTVNMKSEKKLLVAVPGLNVEDAAYDLVI